MQVATGGDFIAIPMFTLTGEPLHVMKYTGAHENDFTADDRLQGLGASFEAGSRVVSPLASGAMWDLSMVRPCHVN